MVPVIIDIVTDPKSLTLVVSAAIMTMVVLGFILRPIWRGLGAQEREARRTILWDGNEAKVVRGKRFGR
jgi:hypothetical protein